MMKHRLTVKWSRSFSTKPKSMKTFNIKGLMLAIFALENSLFVFWGQSLFLFFLVIPV